ncbi:type I-E CRISPR-associated protein Cse1/CasA [Nocardia brasiliensis]|uniref:type I-E CRISPR-associated protein Cse1/CasA n=1 Tax=Nocardia brasiliensis TaxID=37326 RepID=UPI003D94412E
MRLSDTSPPARGRGFNLLDDPWIVALGADGRQRELSILELLEQAAFSTRIGGEVPTQGFAITRLLLAVLHRAIDGPRTTDEWADLWSMEALPTERVRAYAEPLRHRFDLFDAETPFFQVPRLCTAKQEVAGPAKLVADVPNGQPFFTTRSAANLRRIEASEAARWLVHTQAFDPSGIKSGAVGDRTVKNGKGYPIGTGWSGQIGGVLPQGRNLRETLLLNLVAYEASPSVDIGGPVDIPPWERCPDTAVRDERTPGGAIDLYTWQTRRVRLVGDRNGVRGVVLANGDRIASRNRHDMDPHTCWRYSESQSAKYQNVVYMPLTHEAERPVWREIGAMLPSVSSRGDVHRGPARARLAPGIMQWIGDLGVKALLPERYTVHVRTVGAVYGSKGATFAEIVDDLLPLPLLLLREDHPDFGATAASAVEDAEHAASALWSFADNIAQAAGAAPKSGAGEQARDRLYAALDGSYRNWLALLTSGAGVTEARTRWQRTVGSAVNLIAAELALSASPVAWVGREVRGQLVNVGRAELWLRFALRKALPLNGIRPHGPLPAGRGGNTVTGEEPAPRLADRSLGPLGVALDRRLSRLQHEYLRRSAFACAELAELHRGLGKPVGSIPEIWGSTIAVVPCALRGAETSDDDAPSIAEQAAHSVLTLFAAHQRSMSVPAHVPEVSFGSAVSLLAQSRFRTAETITRRFMTVATAQSVDEMLVHLRGLVTLLQTTKQGFDYARLGDDIANLLVPVRARAVRLVWGREFYRTPRTEEATPNRQSPSRKQLRR